MLTVSFEAKNCKSLADFFETVDGLLPRLILEFSTLHSVRSVLVLSCAATLLGILVCV